MKLEGRNVLVSGAGGDLGRHVVRELAPLCGRLIAVDRTFRTPLEVQGIVQEELDLADAEAVAAAFGRWEAAWGAVEAVVNLAGRIHSEPLVNLLKRPDGRHALENWRSTLDSNLDTAFIVCREAAARMAGAFMMSLGSTWWRTGTMPRWLSFVTFAAALTLLIIINLNLWVALIFPAWVLVISLYILVRNLNQPA